MREWVPVGDRIPLGYELLHWAMAAMLWEDEYLNEFCGKV